MQSLQNIGRNTELHHNTELHQHGSTKLTKEDIFKEDVYHLKEIAKQTSKDNR